QNTVCLASALRFIELLFHYEQHSVFTTLARHMQHALQGMEGRLFRKAESELSLLEGLVCLQSAQKTRSKEDHTPNDTFGVVLSEECFGMFEVLYQCVCSSAQDVWPDRDLVLAAVLNLWARLKALFQSTELQPLHSKHYSEHPKLLWCLWALYEVASACDLASTDCLTTGELTFRLALLLEHTANHNKQTSACCDEGAVEPFARSILKRPSGELLHMMCEVAERGQDALSRGWASLPDQTESIDQKSPIPEERQGTANEEAERRTRLCLERPGALSRTALDLNLELLKAHHRASLKRLQLHPEGGSEDDLLDRIRNNKVSRAIFLTQKALVVHGDMEPNRTNKTKSLLEQAVVLIEKAEVEERRSLKPRNPPPSAGQEESPDDGPPPAPLLLSSTNHSLSFIPAPYHTNQQVCWYQICGRAATTIDLRVRLGDHSLQGTGHLVPVVGGQCQLTVEGLEHNQKYVFAVAAYGSKGALLGNAIGQSSRPMLASIPLPTLSTWALLAQVAFETEQFAVAKRACGELWNHFTQSDSPQQSPETHSSTQTNLSPTGLNVERLERSSPLLLRWFLSSFFIETDINVQQGALFCDSLSEKGLHIWAQNARLAECERLLLAVDLGLWCGDSSAALQAVVSCYGLLAPLIYHQIVWEPMVQVLMKCMAVLEENSALFKERRSTETSEALLLMVACLTYYLARALGVLERSDASQVMERGQKLLQGLYQAQVVLSRPTDGPRMSRKLIAASHQEMGLQLRGLSRYQTGGDPKRNSQGNGAGVTHTQDPIGFHHLVLNGDLESAHLDVMKLRRKVFFLEVVVLHLQRAIAADKPDLVVQWATDIFACVLKNDKSMGLSTKGVEAPPTVSLNPPGKHKKHQKETGEEQAVEALIKRLSYVRQKSHQRLQRRCLFEEQRVWRSQLNHLMAQAHLALLHRALAQLHTPAVHERYSQFHPWAFSLARSGVLLAPSSPLGNHRDQPTSAMSIDGDKDEVVSVEDSKDSDEQLDHLDPPITPSAVLDSLHKAALYLRRAMVLAHRGSHWACLQYACRTAWEQSSSLAALVARDPKPPPAAPCPISLDLLESTFTPLLVVATDLLMDMMDTLGLWKALEGEASQEDLESSVGSQVDVRWVQTLVLDTLGLLHAHAKWESLAHYALLFNCFTGGRYTLQVSPLLIHAQKRLLERVTDFNGPPVPQPHHVRTQRYTETPATWRNYADYQLLSGWRPASRSKSNRPHSKLHFHEDHKTKAVSRARGLVRVPLDVEDTQAAYRLALQNQPHSLHLLQHSRTLLQLLLAHTHFTAGVQRGEGGGGQGPPGQVEICPAVTDGPDPRPQDLTCRDFTNPSQLYSLPLGPEHTDTVIAAYAASIKCLEAHGPRVQALHDLGNLQLYSGDSRAAHSSWSKAVDCALHSVGVLDTWDGACWAGGPRSQQETQRLAGVWGCLQAAVITAKTAQYVLVSHLQQRTMCCLLSAYLFKCVLCSSQPHPQRDLLYGSYSVGEQLLPGVDLFSDPIRVHPPTTVASLHFLCHWLYSTRHYVTLLPMLALYLYFVRSRCRDVQRTVEGTLLKVRALTELSMFGQAIKEAVELSHGQGVTLPYGPSINAQQPTRKFHDNKPLTENLQAVEELANCQLSEEVRGRCDPGMSQRFSLARVQLVLALCETVPALPLPGPCAETAVTTEEPSVSTAGPDQDPLDAESPSQGWTEPDGLELELGSEGDRLSLGRVKYVLLDWVQRALESSGGPLQACGGPEYCSSAQQDLEITVEAHLLLSNMHLQLGHAALSADMAARSLEMLQTSASLQGEAPGPSHLNAWQVNEGSPLTVPSPADCPGAVEARERLGAPLWLRCRLALLRGLAAHLPGTAVHPGPDSSEEAARVLKEGLNECTSWGDPDTHALMLLVAAAAHTNRGAHKREADPTAMLHEAVRLLSDRTWMPAASSLALALATMQLGALKGTHSTALLEMGQRLLQQQLTVFGESVQVKSGGVILPPQGLNNIYLPQLPLLAKTTMQIGNILALRAAERGSNPAPEASLPASSPDTQGGLPEPLAPVGPPCQRELPAGVHRWRVAREVLGSALGLSRSSARRDMQLEASLLHCRGIVECSLRFFGLVKRQEVARTFVHCIQTTMTHSHNLQVHHQCYLEVAFLFLQDWQNIPPKTPRQTPNKGSHWRNMMAGLKSRLMVAEEHLMPYWVCLRAAHMVMSSMRSTAQLGGSTAEEDREGGGGGGGGGGGALSSQELSTLPGFARNDLLHSCGGVSKSARDAGTERSFKEDSSTHPTLTWSHLARYYTHLLNLQYATSTGICSTLIAGDVSIAARLSQLHSFYCEHSSSYTETCCPPQPVPARIMLQAPLTQRSRAFRGPMLQEEEEEEVYKWSISPRPQLCVQWYQPCLTPSLGAQDTVILLYGFNSHPISATGGSANGVLGLQCGHYEIRMDRVRAVHAELCEVCVLADIRLSAAEDSLCTSGIAPPSPAATGDKTMKVLEERTLACCLSIQALLRPGPRPTPLTQVPFEVSLENVSELERCFDPFGGAILESSLLTEWILATLIP
ncbi:unnamed protein product, partial [Gadus morhua 'NCC']